MSEVIVSQITVVEGLIQTLGVLNKQLAIGTRYATFRFGSKRFGDGGVYQISVILLTHTVSVAKVVNETLVVAL